VEIFRRRARTYCFRTLDKRGEVAHGGASMPVPFDDCGGAGFFWHRRGPSMLNFMQGFFDVFVNEGDGELTSIKNLLRRSPVPRFLWRVPTEGRARSPFGGPTFGFGKQRDACGAAS